MKDGVGNTPLLLAVAGEQSHWEDNGENFPAVVAALLGAGADLRARDRYGETALHLATAAGDMDVMTLLLGAGERTCMPVLVQPCLLLQLYQLVPPAASHLAWACPTACLTACLTAVEVGTRWS